MRNKALFVLSILFLLIVNVFFISAECNETQINLNVASAEELTEIIYIGEVTAGYIIDSRPFTSLDDLLNVSGIGEIKLTAIKSQGLACVGGTNYTNPNETDDEETSQEIAEEVNEGDADNEKPVVIKVVSSNIKNKSQSDIKENNKLIGLNSKDIKMQDNNKKLSENRIFLYLCLITFTMFIVTLLSIRNYQNGKKRQSEFR